MALTEGHLLPVTCFFTPGYSLRGTSAPIRRSSIMASLRPLRKIDPADFELHPSDVAALPDMAPRLLFMRPRVFLGHFLAALLGVVIVCAGYDLIYTSATNRLVTVVGDIEVAEQGAPLLLPFGSDAAPLSPLMRWLRVSLIVYPQVRPECAGVVGNLSAACLEVPPSALGLRSSILKRERDADEWEWVAGGELVRDRVVCPTSISSRHHPAHHPDPLGLGPHSHCDVFSVAFRAGLASAQYAARVELAASAGEQPSHRAPREWVRGVAFESTHGTAAHGGAELALRALMLLLSLGSLARYARQLHRFERAQLSPQQVAVLLQCGAVCCYNNPLLLLAVPLGASFGPLAVRRLAARTPDWQVCRHSRVCASPSDSWPPVSSTSASSASA